MNQKQDNNSPSQQNKEIKKGIIAARASYSFSGPLPPPELMEKYEKVSKGAAHRIIKMAEGQSNHRQKIEKDVIKSNIFNEKMGMFLAAGLTAIFITAGTVLIILDKSVAGYISLFGPSGFHAYNYIMKKKEENKTRKGEKNEKKEIQQKR